MLRELSGSATDVEDRLHSGEIELPRAENALGERQMERNHARRGQHGALRASVDVLHFRAVLIQADPLDRVVLDETVQRRKRRALPGFLPRSIDSRTWCAGVRKHGERLTSFRVVDRATSMPQGHLNVHPTVVDIPFQQ